MRDSKFEQWICLVKLWIVFSLYRERFHHSTKEVTGYEFEDIMGNSYKLIFQLPEIIIQIWISITNSCTVIYKYAWVMDIHQTYMINMKCKYFMVLQKLQSDPRKMDPFHSKINFVKLSILMPCINKLYLSTLCRLMHRNQQVSGPDSSFDPLGIGSNTILWSWSADRIPQTPITIGSWDRENKKPNSLLPIESWHKSFTGKFIIEIT